MVMILRRHERARGEGPLALLEPQQRQHLTLGQCARDRAEDNAVLAALADVGEIAVEPAHHIGQDRGAERRGRPGDAVEGTRPRAGEPAAGLLLVGGEDVRTERRRGPEPGELRRVSADRERHEGRVRGDRREGAGDHPRRLAVR